MITNFCGAMQRALMLPRVCVLALLGIGSALLPSLANAQASNCLGDVSVTKPYVVSVVPQLPASETYSHWAPVLEAVGLASKQCFTLNISKTIPDFEVELLAGTPDFSYMNPYHQVMAYRRQAYRPLVADATPLTGIVVVRRDSGINKMDDLNGKQLAFPSPNAFAASLITRATLSQRGIDIKPLYVKTHSNVYRSVLQADVVAGGGVNTTLLREPEGLQSQLKVLFESAGYRAHPFSAHPRVPVAVQESVRKAFIAYAGTDAGKAAMNKAQMPQPVAVDYARDYLPLEHLKIEAFVEAPKR
ncbi:phosphate/phosphite/phosphonate ABC transporter substrate-binding protein [Limnohabitans sp.]|uniref:phosphate/phosphite/phosphonate ABC transporter substrate-binding protein n=1 Tax=Limnohabitans sp. TaxID=1907725 RepID=UPI00286F7001|nr:phosphate/phosphite/phosphonate ABC transporter substrate-binding protein [Limnohabitans sp.]